MKVILLGRDFLGESIEATASVASLVLLMLPSDVCKRFPVFGLEEDCNDRPSVLDADPEPNLSF